MRSLLWTAIYIVLMAELCLTLILVIPFPRKIRSKICMSVSKLELKKRLQMPLTGLFFALVMALMDTANYLNNIYAKKEEEHQLHIQQHIDTNPIDKHLLKEKEYKAGRNLYLAAFALTLLFVIGRITELMQEHADLEGKIENLKLAVSMSEKNHNSNEKPPAAAAENDSSIEGIEMKSMDLKKKE